MSWSMVGLKDRTARLIGALSGVHCKNAIRPFPPCRYHQVVSLQDMVSTNIQHMLLITFTKWTSIVHTL